MYCLTGRSLLTEHIGTEHRNVTEWECSKCATSLNNHHSLYNHMLNYHYTGQFECAYPQCHFGAHRRYKVIQHYNKTHKTHPFQCQYEGCGKTFSCKSNLTTHLIIHRGVMPYRCTWPDCQYNSNRTETVVRHIRMVHFKLPASQRVQRERNIVDDRDPKEFLQVLSDLL